MLTQGKKLLVALLALVMLSVSSASASAQEPTDDPNALKPVTSAEETHALDAASNELANLSGEALLGDQPAVVTQTADGSHYVVSVGIAGDKIDKGSYVAVMLDQSSLEVAQVIQVNLDVLDEQSADITMWIDGELFKEQHFTLEDEASDDTVTTQASRQDIIDCIAASGAGVVAAAAIVATCGALCAVTVGAGCIACAAGISALGGAYVGKCFNMD